MNAPQRPFSMAQPDPADAGLRHTALLLHAMQERDRRWLLEHVPSAARVQVDSLLAELRTLGIPRDRGLLRAAVAQRASAPAASPTSNAAVPQPACSHSVPLSQQDALDRIVPSEQPAAWQRLCAVCKQEPAGLVAEWFALHDWSWKAAALRLLPARKRAQVLALLDVLAVRQTPPAAMHAALVQLLYIRIVTAQSLPGAEPTVAPALAGMPGPIHTAEPALRTAAPWWRRFTTGR